MISNILSIILYLCLLTVPAAFVTHMVTSVITEHWLMLILGTIIFPVGVIHGYLIWLGVV